MVFLRAERLKRATAGTIPAVLAMCLARSGVESHTSMILFFGQVEAPQAGRAIRIQFPCGRSAV